MSEKVELRGLTYEEVETLVLDMGEKKFRAKQIFQWVNKGIASFDEASNLSKPLREKLEERFYLDNVQVLKVMSSSDGTKKFLLSLADGDVIEAVLMKYKHGNSICISTQVGCKMGCTFCASTIGGLVRNLTAGEIVGQIFAVQNHSDLKINNIVLMGSGEPLDNYDNVLKFLRLVNNKEGMNIGMRNITLSTCGLSDQIKRLANENLQITLAISLHCANDGDRSRLMPINRQFSIPSLMAACDYYIEKTNRRITFEYGLINGVNDTEDVAHQLGKLLKGRLCHVNLIPINKVEERDYHPSDNRSIMKFKKVLESYGVVTTVRRELGSDINAACGQLRKSHIES